MAETARFQEGAAQYFDLMFTQVHARLSAYMFEPFAIECLGRARKLVEERNDAALLYASLSRH
jgi:hypothetical protein